MIAVLKNRFLHELVQVTKIRCRNPSLTLPIRRSLIRTPCLASCTTRPPDKSKPNIILMGPPGAGKTSVGRLLAQTLGMPVVDIDDDVLEKTWNMPVAQKLFEVGGDAFLEEEGEAVCNFFTSGSVISLTGSNPLHTESMQHLKKNGMVVYLDVDTDDILQRLAMMKVNRIVGQEAGASMRDILMYRKQFYERWLDTRVLCGCGDSIVEVAQKVLNALKRFQDSESETFISTRNHSSSSVKGEIEPKFFSDVVVEGLAPDGGLYVPNRGFPKLTPQEWKHLSKLTYPERACAILEKCIHPTDVSPKELGGMVRRAYSSNFSSQAIAPLRHLCHNQYVLELFHGPTASFKDFALQLMPQLFAHCLPQMCNYLILVATSGDTGGAVLSGFGALDAVAHQRVGVLVFFPERGVSEIQKLQMTGIREGNARAVGVTSDFDFCQRAIKRMFGDASLTGHLAVEYATVLSTANSINWARLLPQVIYHASAYLDLLRDGVVAFGDPVDVCIPTGNFGNAMSALYAKEMGIPIRKVICASNVNCVVADFINTGHYDLRGRRLSVSHSPSIDILKSSNLERFLYHISSGDSELVRDLFTSLDKHNHFKVSEEMLEKIGLHVQAGWCSEEDCLAAIRDVHVQTGYVMDTHTAVAKVVADRLRTDNPRVPTVICSTAHYGKFAPAVLTALQRGAVPREPLDQLLWFDSTGEGGGGGVQSRADGGRGRVGVASPGGVEGGSGGVAERADKATVVPVGGEAGAIGVVPAMHAALVQCLRESSGQQHRVCKDDFHLLTEEVEHMIHDTFLKVH